MQLTGNGVTGSWAGDEGRRDELKMKYMYRRNDSEADCLGTKGVRSWCCTETQTITDNEEARDEKQSAVSETLYSHHRRGAYSPIKVRALATIFDCYLLGNPSKTHREIITLMSICTLNETYEQREPTFGTESVALGTSCA